MPRRSKKTDHRKHEEHGHAASRAAGFGSVGVVRVSVVDLGFAGL